MWAGCTCCQATHLQNVNLWLVLLWDAALHAVMGYPDKLAMCSCEQCGCTLLPHSCCGAAVCSGQERPCCGASGRSLQCRLTGSSLACSDACPVADHPPACRYAFALTSCVLQASYLLLVERSGADKGLGPLELMLYVSLLSLPFLVVVSLAS